jgi:predicted nucleotide-binding protein
LSKDSAEFFVADLKSTVNNTDDIGSKAVLTSDDHKTRHRARQNVVFELGFFIGALGPERVAAIVKGDIERPSDFDGVVYIAYEDNDWQRSLARELGAAELEVDWKALAHS